MMKTTAIISSKGFGGLCISFPLDTGSILRTAANALCFRYSDAIKSELVVLICSVQVEASGDIGLKHESLGLKAMI